MSLTAGKIAEVMFEQALDTYEDQFQLADKTMVYKPDGKTMQNSGNTIWRTVDQHAPVIEGWDMTGNEQGIIQETYAAYLGTPKNDFVQQRIDDMRDISFWEGRGRASGRAQANDLNKAVANLISTTGSMYYRSNATSGFDFIAEGQALYNERQGAMNKRCFVLNDRDTLKFSKDLAGRQTLQGKPDDVWAKGQLASNVAEFDVFTGSFLPNLAGGTASTTTSAAASFKPEAGSVDPTTNIVTNIDYRDATIAVTSSAAFSVGDKITISNGADAIQAIGKADKTPTGQAMTFTVVGKPNGTSLKIWPKPIAADDAALSLTEKAYANVDTTITSGATVDQVNIDATAKTNLMFDTDSIEIVGGDIPAQLLAQYDGMKVIPQTLKNGLTMYMVYDANMVNMNLRYRLFTWYGLTNKDPSRNGVAVSY